MSSATHLSADGRQIVKEAFKESRLAQPMPMFKAGTSNCSPTENLVTIQTKAQVKQTPTLYGTHYCLNMAFLVNNPKEMITGLFTETSLVSLNKNIFLEIKYKSGQ